ncbi:MAG TPA: SDR family oxidoreductase [Bryobacteraceae bacterium]|nr:SDR family oxidoreductase [Bryobacteraceae bacterium]
MDYTGKAIVVTGGASGIGRAAAREFASRQGTVAILDRDERGGEETAASLRAAGFDAVFFPVDLTAGAQVETAIEQAAARMGGLDVLANVAGIQRYGTAVTTSEAGWDEVMNANVRSAFLASRSAIPHMIRRGGGSIVVVGSVQSMTAQRNSMAYVTSKHALVGLARSMAVDFAANNIRVNCVCPGAIDTPMLRWASSLDDDPERVLDVCRKLSVFGRLGEPEEIARVIAFLASDLASFITGAVMVADGGLLTPTGGMANQEAGTGGGSQ